MNANSHQEFEFADAAREGSLAQHASTTLQREAYDGKLPSLSRPSSTIAIGNLELIQTGPVASGKQPTADGRAGEADQQPKPIDGKQSLVDDEGRRVQSKEPFQEQWEIRQKAPVADGLFEKLPRPADTIENQKIKEVSKNFIKAMNKMDLKAVQEILQELNKDFDFAKKVLDNLKQQCTAESFRYEIPYSDSRAAKYGIQLHFLKMGQERTPTTYSATISATEAYGKVSHYPLYGGKAEHNLDSQSALSAFKFAFYSQYDDADDMSLPSSSRPGDGSSAPISVPKSGPWFALPETWQIRK